MIDTLHGSWRECSTQGAKMTQQTVDQMESTSDGSEGEGLAFTRENGSVASPTKLPPLHIDIQIHIDPASSAELIDQIFASMAKHLYGDGS